VFSVPPFVISAFELTFLFGGLASALAILVLGHLPKLRPSPTYDPRFTLDRFGVAVACSPDAVDSVSSVLSTAGAEEVRR
jgi:molybdopterin-containing oxidoreductase family membrane subunit